MPGANTATTCQHTAALLTSAGAAATYGARVTDVDTKAVKVAVLSAKSYHAPPALVWYPSATCCGPVPEE